jgi:MOSC domain-containing protein YiiM
MTSASVVSVSRDPEHRFSKEVVDDIVLIAGLGVEGDAHAGTTVQHRSRVARDPSQPNLRQVHLVHAELFDEVEGSGFEVAPGELGENVTTRGVDLLGLPRGAVLRLGPDAVVQVTGLRNPCVQIDGFEAGLMRELVTRDDSGQVVRKAGVMAVVLAGGRVAPGDSVGVELPEGEHEALQPV